MFRRHPVLCAVATAALSALGLSVPAVASAGPLPRAQQPPPPVYQPVGPGTHFIDDAAKLAGFNDPQWYEANIPFLDVPDTQIEDVLHARRLQETYRPR